MTKIKSCANDNFYAFNCQLFWIYQSLDRLVSCKPDFTFILSITMFRNERISRAVYDFTTVMVMYIYMFSNA